MYAGTTSGNRNRLDQQCSVQPASLMIVLGRSKLADRVPIVHGRESVEGREVHAIGQKTNTAIRQTDVNPARMERIHNRIEIPRTIRPRD